MFFSKLVSAHVTVSCADTSLEKNTEKTLQEEIISFGFTTTNPLWESCFLTEVCDTFYQILLMESQLLNRNIITNTLRHYHNAHTCASFAHNPVVREIGQN